MMPGPNCKVVEGYCIHVIAVIVYLEKSLQPLMITTKHVAMFGQIFGDELAVLCHVCVGVCRCHVGTAKDA